MTDRLHTCLFCWLHLIWVAFDIKVDGELQFDAFLHCLLQGWDLLSSKSVPGDERTQMFQCDLRLTCCF